MKLNKSNFDQKLVKVHSQQFKNFKSLTCAWQKVRYFFKIVFGGFSL